MAIESAYTDPEIHDWLIWAQEHGSGFLRAVAEAALVADLKSYNLLRPVRPHSCVPSNAAMALLPSSTLAPGLER